ncbi:hypothetical protein WJX84_010650 [Apatococcus fuscideae]|uniref:Peptidase S54 rhomboid domain-containing protein n=1 Tax=Apatococcus fuscideae TaxID=2026836 RepID=A0AAW1T5T6_9CHLO
MSRPLFHEVLAQPATSVLILLCTFIWLKARSAGVGYSELGLNYERCVKHKEIWRFFSAQFTHVEPLHLLLNMSTLWSIGRTERSTSAVHAGLGDYFKNSLLLLYLVPMVCLSIYHFLINVMKKEQFAQVQMVGYSGVLFGWLTILTQRGASFSLMGMATLPMPMVPLGFLIFTYLIIPKSSLVGHLSGILVGYLLASGALDPLNLYWMLSISAWMGIGVIWSLAHSGMLPASWIKLHGEGDVETGPGPRIQNGILQR